MLTKGQVENFGSILLALRHMQNNTMLAPGLLTIEAIEAQNCLQEIVGEEMKKVYSSRVWKNAGPVQTSKTK